MTEQEVFELMSGSQTEKEWEDNCNHVKRECKGYPDFWYKNIVMSGLAAEVLGRWSGDADIHIS